MKTMNLVSLAKNENTTLAYLTSNWMKSHPKSANPVSSAIRVYSLVQTVVIALIVFAIFVVFVLDTLFAINGPAAFVLTITILCSIGILIGFAWADWTRNVRRFCSAITVLEIKLGPLNTKSSEYDGQWYISPSACENSYWARGVVEKFNPIFRGMADSIEKLDHISWAQSKKAKLRNNFANILALLRDILNCKLEMKDYVTVKINLPRRS